MVCSGFLLTSSLARGDEKTVGGGYALALIAQKMIRRLLSDELIHIRQKMDIAADKLEIMDRKLTVLLKDALDQRQQR